MGQDAKHILVPGYDHTVPPGQNTWLQGPFGFGAKVHCASPSTKAGFVCSRTVRGHGADRPKTGWTPGRVRRDALYLFSVPPIVLVLVLGLRLKVGLPGFCWRRSKSDNEDDHENDWEDYASDEKAAR